MVKHHPCNVEIVSSILTSCSSYWLDKMDECAKVCLAIRQQGTELTPFSSLPCIQALDRRFGCGFESRPARSDKKTLLQIAGSSTRVEQIACLSYCSSNSAVRVGVLYASGQWFKSILEHQFLSNHERKKNVSIY